MKLYVDAIETGKCDASANAVEFLENKNCDCCAPDYLPETSNEDTSYDDHNIYMLVKNEKYLDDLEIPIQ